MPTLIKVDSTGLELASQLDLMLRTVLAGRNYSTISPTGWGCGPRAALQVRGATPEDVALACAAEVQITFGVQIQQYGIFGYTKDAIAIAFTARGVPGLEIETAGQRRSRLDRERIEQQQAAQRRLAASATVNLPASRSITPPPDRDPVWLVLPWGAICERRWGYLAGLSDGISNMLNQHYAAAIAALQRAVQFIHSEQADTQLLMHRVLAANIGLLVQAAHNEVHP